MKNRRKFKILSCNGMTFTLVMLMAISANAGLINFNATGLPGISGFVEFDDTNFAGTAGDFISNIDINDLSLNVFGYMFSTSDVVTTDSTIIDTTGAIPIIDNGAGFLANNGSQSVLFFPDNYNNSGSDGDASLAFTMDPNNLSVYSFYQVAWVVGPKMEPIPEPATMLLLGTGLVGVAGAARRRKKKNRA